MLASSSERSMSLTASSRTAASGLDSAKRATVVRSTRRSRLLVPILRQAVCAARRRRPCSVSGSIELERGRLVVGRLDDEDLLIAVADVEAVLENAVSTGRALGWPLSLRRVDDRFLVGEAGLAQLAERGEKASSSGDCAQRRRRTPEGGEQQPTATARPPAPRPHL